MGLQELAERVVQALAADDFDAARDARRDIVGGFPDSDEAAEAYYRLGVDALFRARDVVAAMALFEQGAARRHAYWSAAARTSLALCYAQQKRRQKALFELRKVALVKDPSPHSVAALTWMETLCAEDGEAEEAAKARTLRIAQLRLLVEQKNCSPADRGGYLYQLGSALLDAGEKAEGRKTLLAARALGPQVLGQNVAQGVAEALRG